MSDMDTEALRKRLQSLCDELEVKRLDADDIVELITDGEDPAWVSEQAIEEAGEARTKLSELLSELAPLVYVAPEPVEEDEGVAESESAMVDEGAEGDADTEEAVVDEAPVDLQAQLAELRDALSPGVDPAQLEQLLSSERGQLMADFGTFCQERGYEGEPTGGMDAEMQALHEEWLQTPRETLDGKKPSQLLDGGGLFPEPVVTYRREEAKVGRNDPCPCGSGKKFKKCCGR